jgi:hypothetical protein
VDNPVSPGTRLTATAEAQVDKLIEGAVLADKQRLLLKRQVRNLRFGFFLLLLIVVGLGWTALQAHSTAAGLRASSYTSCVSGNSARGTNQKIWDEFLTILIDDPQVAKTRASLESKVASLNLTTAEQQGLDAVIAANWTANPGNTALAKTFEAYIAAHEKSQDCTALYH